MRKLKLYIDSCCLNRVFDDQTYSKIYLESVAMTVVFNYIDNSIFDLISSDVLLFESEKNPYFERQEFVNKVLLKAKYFQEINDDLLNRAKEIELDGIKGMDSLHIACAEEQSADFFITCDDRIIKKYTGKMKIQNPVVFCAEFREE